MFSNFRSAHEPEASDLHHVILSDTKIDRIGLIRLRDETLNLEMNSSQLNYFFIHELVMALPEAKFILTIRDCYSWLDSFINHQLSRPSDHNWERVRELRFGKKENHPVEERAFAERELYTLEGYLRYWARHNADIISAVPPSRLLIVKTNDLAKSADVISSFLGILPSEIAVKHSHEHLATTKHSVLKEVSRDYLEYKVSLCCGNLMECFFPEIVKLPDAI
jgi:hypothetical protein